MISIPSVFRNSSIDWALAASAPEVVAPFRNDRARVCTHGA